MAEIAEECKQECYDLFVLAAQQEKEWADYLFRDGSMIGLNKDILCQYVEYITNIRMQAVGLDLAIPDAFQPIRGSTPGWCPITQVAPQEVEAVSYRSVRLILEVNTDDLSNFSSDDARNAESFGHRSAVPKSTLPCWQPLRRIR